MEIPYGFSMGHSGHDPFDFTMGLQWVCPNGSQVGFEWVNPNPCESHGPTVTHAKPMRDYDGFAIWGLWGGGTSFFSVGQRGRPKFFEGHRGGGPEFFPKMGDL